MGRDRLSGTPSGETRDDDALAGSRLENFLADYIDRLNGGERILPEQILFEHPDGGEEILRQLEAWVGAEKLARASSGTRPLGTLGDDTLRRQIGRGGMGVVYDAWQNSVDRPVALKVLPAGVAVDTRTVTRFVREAKTAAQLHHPSVVPVFGMQGDSEVENIRDRRLEGGVVSWHRRQPDGGG